MSHKSLPFALIALGLLWLTLPLSKPTHASQAPSLEPIEQLGKALYFDKNLSQNGNQSCATCHDSAVGFTGGSTQADSEINAHGAVYPGSDPKLFGNRKPPSAAYAGDGPALRYDADLKTWIGGMFWDGRADGAALGDPLAEQAKGPFLNPLEMGLASAEELCNKVKVGTYTALFEQVWGVGSLDCTQADAAYDQIGKSIAAYERSAEVSAYSSRFDVFWDQAKANHLDVTRINMGNWTSYRGLQLNDAELFGLALFNDPRQADCAACHSLKPGSKGYPLFTDYSYDNLGVPRNPDNPFYTNLAYNPAGAAWIDTGLGGYLVKAQPQTAAQENGKMKVPTLRNVDKRPDPHFVRAYGHNGSFKSLSEVIQFYLMRGMLGGGMGRGMGMGGMGMGGMGMGGMGMGGMGMGGMGMGGMGMGGMGMGGMGMSGMGMSGMRMGRMMSLQPEVNANLATLNMIHPPAQRYLLAFLQTLSDGYIQR